jgi:hypothetical protein
VEVSKNMKLIFAAVAAIFLITIVALIRPVHAEQEGTLYKTGQRLTLAFPGDRFVECNISEIRGAFVQCEDNKITWYNTATTIAITVR